MKYLFKYLDMEACRTDVHPTPHVRVEYCYPYVYTIREYPDAYLISFYYEGYRFTDYEIGLRHNPEASARRYCDRCNSKNHAREEHWNRLNVRG